MKGRIVVLAMALCISAAAVMGQTTQPSAELSTQPSTQISATIDQAKAAAQTIQNRAVTTASQIKEEGLPPGAIIALIVVGAFAGNTIGNLLKMNNTMATHIISLLIGGIGTFLAAFIVKVTGIDVGLPQITFKTESLLLALVVTFVLMLIFVKTRGGVNRMTSPGAPPRH